MSDAPVEHTHNQHPRVRPLVNRPRVKICGLTQVDNALACADAGADMIGLVFFEKSPRHVSLEQARAITRALPRDVMPCGVFVDQAFDTLMNIAQTCNLVGIQLHGNESPQLVQRLSDQGLTVIKAFFAARAPDIASAMSYPAADLCLVEYGKGILPGGNAETWDYDTVSGQTFPAPLILAGGLTPENVNHAVSLVKPYAVDASSSLESGPGIKDINRVKAFIASAKGIALAKGAGNMPPAG